MANQSDELIARAKPQPAYPDGTLNARRRVGPYGELFTQPLYTTKHALADEGSYFVAVNPTIGTALAAGIQTTFSDTLAALVIQNTGKAGVGAPNLYLDYIDLIITVAPASATSLMYATKLEPSSLRAPTSGNAAFGTGQNPNTNSALTPVTAIQSFTGGAWMTVPAATAQARITGRGTMRGVIPAVGDELTIAFGSVDPGGSAAGVSTGSRQASSHAPVVIGPGGSFTLHLWAPGNAATGLSAEAEVGFWER